MFRLRLKHTPRLMFLIPGVFNKSTEKPVNEDELKPGHIGVDRVIDIFRRQDHGKMSPELERIGYSVILSSAGGGFIGGVMAMLGVTRRYKEENVVTQYYTHLRASRALQTKLLWEFFKGSYSIGWRTGLFVGVFQTAATMLYVYDGKMKVDHYTMAGALTGACYQFPKGIKPAISGFVFGALFGSVAGLAIKGMLYASGYTLSDIYDARTQYLERLEKKEFEHQGDRTLPQVKQMYEELARHKE